ncbi:MAG TPA: hypothetical protein QGG37_02485 [Chloroflexota bacterium]|nr:hypothetical protein [Chloroflexota bacterium]
MRVAVIAQVAAAGSNLDGELREAAAGEAHRLTCSPGTFGLSAGSEVA